VPRRRFHAGCDRVACRYPPRCIVVSPSGCSAGRWLTGDQFVKLLRPLRIASGRLPLCVKSQKYCDAARRFDSWRSRSTRMGSEPVGRPHVRTRRPPAQENSHDQRRKTLRCIGRA
jgi:hypothetical protein